MQKQAPTVRAVDVGYGHVKWTEGRDTSGHIIADTFPSQAPLVTEGKGKTEIMQQRDTFVIPVNGKNYVVGRQVKLEIGKNQELEQLDSTFALSDGYTARLYGALNYMLPTLPPSRTIDFLMLGLPLTTINRNSDQLMSRFIGDHVINAKGDTVSIKSCAVYPQPLGGYAAYLQRPLARHSQPPMALVIDVGYNTVDWVTREGMVDNPSLSDAVERGMSGFLREVAKTVIETSGIPETESAVVRMLDQHMINGGEFRLAGKLIDISKHTQAGNTILEQAAQAIKNNIGVGGSIDLIIISGGGAKLYAPWIQKQFPHHEIITLPAPALANVRGFHQFGEWIAESASRANHLAVVAPECVE